MPGAAPGAGSPFGNFGGPGGGVGDMFGQFLRDDFSRGLLLGAAAAYLIANPTLQQATISSVVKAWNSVQGGFSELRERFRDAEAELERKGEGTKPEDT